MNRRPALIALLTLLSSSNARAGAWGPGAFQNDDALDWVARCVASSNSLGIASALRAALSAFYLEARLGSAAIAAAEVVAAALGRARPDLPAELRTWLVRQRIDEVAALAALARSAVARVKDHRSSELWQLWSEGNASAWLSELAALESRLAS